MYKKLIGMRGKLKAMDLRRYRKDLFNDGENNINGSRDITNGSRDIANGSRDIANRAYDGN